MGFYIPYRIWKPKILFTKTLYSLLLMPLKQIKAIVLFFRKFVNLCNCVMNSLLFQNVQLHNPINSRFGCGVHICFLQQIPSQHYQVNSCHNFHIIFHAAYYILEWVIKEIWGFEAFLFIEYCI